MTTKDPEALLNLANVFVNEATERETLNKQDVDGRTPERKLLFPEKSIAAHGKFVKDCLDTPVNCLDRTFSTASGIKRALRCYEHILNSDRENMSESLMGR